MPPVLSALCAWIAPLVCSRALLCLENLAWWHQIIVYPQTVARPRWGKTSSALQNELVQTIAMTVMKDV
jgi:hypothetical protein